MKSKGVKVPKYFLVYDPSSRSYHRIDFKDPLAPIQKP